MAGMNLVRRMCKVLDGLKNMNAGQQNIQMKLQFKIKLADSILISVKTISHEPFDCIIMYCKLSSFIAINLYE